MNPRSLVPAEARAPASPPPSCHTCLRGRPGRAALLASSGPIFTMVFAALLLVVSFGLLLIVTLLQGSLPGFPFLASIIALFSGTQLFALGIIGEYLARMFNRSVERPSYVIGECLTAREPLEKV